MPCVQCAKGISAKLVHLYLAASVVTILQLTTVQQKLLERNTDQGRPAKCGGRPALIVTLNAGSRANGVIDHYRVNDNSGILEKLIWIGFALMHLQATAGNQIKHEGQVTCPLASSAARC